ncbi:MAG: amidohydrolase family protein [Bacillota bacterium]|nr:amidohydrolase family protein [Bacillota bacterium]
MDNFELNTIDRQLIDKLAAFLPKKIFDAHAHLYDAAFVPNMHDPESNVFSRRQLNCADYLQYQGALYPGAEMMRINIVTMPDRAMADRSNGLRDASVRFLVDQLTRCPDHVGEVFVLPDDTENDIESLLVHPNIRGFKCYHLVAARQPTWQAGIAEYLPESAWRVAHEKELCITLHMVRDRALADTGNRAYIKEMAHKYPRATLILAHAARGFAAWTTVESVAELAGLENVWFDLSAICESPPMMAILKHCGVKRVLWGSDFPISMARGKAISLGDGFYWIYKQDLARFQAATPIRATLVGIENLLAVQEACMLLDLDKPAIEDIFYNNAMRLFRLTDQEL